MHNKEDIQKRLNELILEENIEKKFYHFRSIQNFINFSDDLGDSQLKETVFTILIEYLDRVKEDPIQDLNQCSSLFNQYIRPVGNLYEMHAGFMPLLSSWVITFWAILLFCILYIFNAPLTFFYIIGILLLFYYIYLLKKRFEKRVYGLEW